MGGYREEDGSMGRGGLLGLLSSVEMAIERVSDC